MNSSWYISSAPISAVQSMICLLYTSSRIYCNYYPNYLIKLTCLQISSVAASFFLLYSIFLSSKRLSPFASIETISGPNSFTRQFQSVSGIPRSLHSALTISSTSVAATTALPAGNTQWIAPNSLHARSVFSLDVYKRQLFILFSFYQLTLSKNIKEG